MLLCRDRLLIILFVIIPFVVGTGLLLGTAARADNEPSRSDADACQPDIHRLCDKFFPDETLVATCLVDRRADLSTQCAEVLARPPGPSGPNPH